MQERPTRQLRSLQLGPEKADDQTAQHILYVDEHRLTRDCISRELARFLPELSVEDRATAKDLASETLDLSDIALVALNTHSNDINDANVAAELSILERVVPDVPVVLFSDVGIASSIVEAFRHGIRGYLPTTLPIRQAAEVIRFVRAGGTFIPPSILSSPGFADQLEEKGLTIAPTMVTSFSPRQREVLHRLWMGKSNKLIAYELSMCESTVKVHIRQIMKKLNVSNRTQVVVATRPPYFNGDAADQQPVACSLGDDGSARRLPYGSPRFGNGALTKKNGLGSEC